jgi:hypothetical protein
MSDDKPKRSWREIDKGKDRSRSRGAPERGEPEKTSAAYSKYKGHLDKLFTPGGESLPASLKEKLGPVSEDSRKQAEALNLLRKEPSEAHLRAFLDAGHQLPSEPRLLLSLLGGQDQALFGQVLSTLEASLTEGKKISPMLVKQRIEAIRHLIEDPAILATMGRIEHLV